MCIYIYIYTCTHYIAHSTVGLRRLDHKLVSDFKLIGCMVSFHNFKSKNFKLSVSNPKSK